VLPRLACEIELLTKREGTLARTVSGAANAVACSLPLPVQSSISSSSCEWNRVPFAVAAGCIFLALTHEWPVKLRAITSPSSSPRHGNPNMVLKPKLHPVKKRAAFGSLSATHDRSIPPRVKDRMPGSITIASTSEGTLRSSRLIHPRRSHNWFVLMTPRSKGNGRLLRNPQCWQQGAGRLRHKTTHGRYAHLKGGPYCRHEQGWV